MTEYAKFTIQKPAHAPQLSHDNVQAAKEARRKILDAVFERRHDIYKRYIQKQRLQAMSKIDMIA